MNKLLRICAAGLMGLLLLLPALCTADEYDFFLTGLDDDGVVAQLGTPSSSGSENVPFVMPGENPVTAGVNPITGEAYSGSYRPVLVNIDTHPRALPHWGVSSADLMYEMPIQADGSTRSVALFMGEYPDGAGPVRSARIPMASLREMWGGLYCFYGYQEGTTDVRKWVRNYAAEKEFAYPYYLNGLNKMSKWFPGYKDGHVAPHNVRLDMAQVAADYSLNPKPHPYVFSQTGLDCGEKVHGVAITYKATNPSYISAYSYNESTGLYDRYANGEPYIDADNGEHCAYANVIVLRTDIKWMNGNNSRPVIRLHGTGPCEIFQSGRYIRGTWARKCSETENLGERMVFFDKSGRELTMKTGKTFIQIVDNEQPVIVVSGAEIAGSVEPQEQRIRVGEKKK